MLLARTWLFTPATRPERFAKAKDSGADVLLIDLEDAVAPRDKDEARRAALNALSATTRPAARIALRVNALDSAQGLADLSAVLATDAAPDFLVLPKTESATHLHILDRLLSTRAFDTLLVGLVESARGLQAANAIATATPRLHGLMLGTADLAADLGTEPAWEPLLYARSHLVAACAAGGIAAIDTPFFDLRDADGLAVEARRAVSLGFVAKAAIHPNQVAAINAALTPTEQQVAEARAVLTENKKGVGTVSGRMIDEAVARRARRILAAAPDQPEKE